MVEEKNRFKLFLKHRYLARFISLIIVLSSFFNSFIPSSALDTRFGGYGIVSSDEFENFDIQSLLNTMDLGEAEKKILAENFLENISKLRLNKDELSPKNIDINELMRNKLSLEDLKRLDSLDLGEFEIDLENKEKGLNIITNIKSEESQEIIEEGSIAKEDDKNKGSFDDTQNDDFTKEAETKVPGVSVPIDDPDVYEGDNDDALDRSANQGGPIIEKDAGLLNPEDEVDGFGFRSIGIAFGAVKFITQDDKGNKMNGVKISLQEEVKLSDRSNFVEIKQVTSSNGGEVSLTGLKLNTKYRIFVVGMYRDYETPTDFVSEFSFDLSGIRFTKGNTAVILKKIANGNNIGTGGYYGYVGYDGKLKISKTNNQYSGTNAFCFNAYNTFPKYGDNAYYQKLESNASSFQSEASKPRYNDRRLYDSIRRVIAYSEKNKQTLLTTYGLGSNLFRIDGNQASDQGYYMALQRAIWYYTDSIDPSTSNTKYYNKYAAYYSTLKRAVELIIRESQKVSDEEMNAVKVSLYKTSSRSNTKTPYQSLVTYEVENIKKSNIRIYKVDSEGGSLRGAVFRLESTSNPSFKAQTLGQGGNLDVFDFKDLTKGEYRLTEVTTPQGYKAIDPIVFEVYDDGKELKTWLKSNSEHVYLDENGFSIRVVNKKIMGEVEFTKEDTDGKKLDGVEFELKKYDPNKKRFETYYASLLSEDGGRLKIQDLELDGRYQLWEINPLSGYEKPKDAVSEFTVDNTGKVTLIKGENRIINKKISRIVLPNTGGKGVRGIYFLGMIFVLGFFVLYVFKRRIKFTDV